MQRIRPASLLHFQGLVLISLLLLGAWLPAHAADYTAETLRAKYSRIESRLKDNAFHRPLHLESIEKPHTLKGDIYAVLDYPYEMVNATLNDPARTPVRWCELLSLHLNVKYCQSQGTTLDMYIGKKVDQPLEEAYSMQFRYRVISDSKTHFAVGLDAAEGPLGTRDYHIVLEAIPLDGKTFMHLTYSYSYGHSSKLMMKTYLATLGRNKVGFTPVTPGKPDLVRGMRGVVERNAMRYYLTVDAYLKSRQAPPEQQFQKSLEYWFDATEHYARQLHEIDREVYIDMKHHERQRQKERSRQWARE